eukprot:168567-Chlamydomonas_euryale.AAC.1
MARSRAASPALMTCCPGRFSLLGLSHNIGRGAGPLASEWRVPKRSPANPPLKAVFRLVVPNARLTETAGRSTLEGRRVQK